MPIDLSSYYLVTSIPPIVRTSAHFSPDSGFRGSMRAWSTVQGSVRSSLVCDMQSGECIGVHVCASRVGGHQAAKWEEH